ncbi:NAD(P) transhydrogenase subunit alpha [Frankia sp. AgB1.9]|uniref:NAD(P) transhydrogenase subunit alpha n=1 Tax=unclassified Frankia TaxID=2632575 RepID=UPI0019331C68|nr:MULTISPECIES: NAD(P) transhydrogenase subunit alpha [unclassified Frankia]MBL7489876.1 NAD(P) transhydrogenase subunit alpha [Frankia sp. AgW1.1]MBL7552911.1 NAD(P) transhydrogenase subunit alpha [Frankia sp. AgB1.9]MBL7624459.1 NAD(P) transhydrogenase subunit alpha [Frankia sp. AgB1.8]
MRIGVVHETAVGERRVALIPQEVDGLRKAGHEVLVETGAGAAAGFPDAAYAERGAVIASATDVLGAEVVLFVRAPGSDPTLADALLAWLRPGQVTVGLADPLGAPAAAAAIASAGITSFALDLLPRITRAQAMDVLSSQATLAGYKAALLAASRLNKIFPMLTTAAGTLPPARALVIGAGVAGLQAIATCKRLGAVVSAYDVRPAAREQAESVGATFVDLGLDAADAETTGGYAAALGEDFYRRQREALGKVVAASDIVITTAQVQGVQAPILVTAEMVHAMAPGSVVVDLAAAQGGNCELSEPDTEVDVDGVTLLAPTNLPATVPAHASRLYAKNLTNFLKLLIVDGAVRLDLDDQIIADTLVTHGGEVVAPRVRERLGLAAVSPTAPAEPAGPAEPTGPDAPAGPAAGQATDVPTTAGS